MTQHVQAQCLAQGYFSCTRNSSLLLQSDKIKNNGKVIIVMNFKLNVVACQKQILKAFLFYPMHGFFLVLGCSSVDWAYANQKQLFFVNKIIINCSKIVSSFREFTST